MSNSERDYETYSKERFETDRSEVSSKKRYSTKGISLNNPIDYGRKRKSKKQRQKEVSESSKYTEYSDDDDDGNSISDSDDNDDNKGKQLSDRAKLQQLEEQLVKSKNLQSAKHKGRDTESEEDSESEYDDSEYETTSEEESVKGKEPKVVQKVNKPVVKQKPRSEDEDLEETETGSETEEETETEEEDYAAFLMKQLAAQNMEDSKIYKLNTNSAETKEGKLKTSSDSEKKVAPCQNNPNEDKEEDTETSRTTLNDGRDLSDNNPAMRVNSSKARDSREISHGEGKGPFTCRNFSSESHFFFANERFLSPYEQRGILSSPL